LHFDTEQFVQKTAVALVVLTALAAVAVTLASAFNLWPWITLPVAWNGVEVPWAGMAAQIGLTAILVLFALTMPAALRVLRLERTHRDFAISMSDVAEAYALCHAADRQGAFTLSREYDAVRERIAYMRQHPRLADLEPAVLTAAAQMSTVSKDLAETYSDEALDRARGFLEERQHEVERFRSQIDTVTEEVNGLRRWLESVELDESICESQLRQLEDQMGETMEKVGLIRADMAPPDRPVRLRRVAE
jgi:hypothetical protein